MAELKDQLSLLGRNTEYKQDYSPDVLGLLIINIPEMIIGYDLIVPNLRVVSYYWSARFRGDTHCLSAR